MVAKLFTIVSIITNGMLSNVTYLPPNSYIVSAYVSQVGTPTTIDGTNYIRVGTNGGLTSIVGSTLLLTNATLNASTLLTITASPALNTKKPIGIVFSVTNTNAGVALAGSAANIRLTIVGVQK